MFMNRILCCVCLALILSSSCEDPRKKLKPITPEVSVVEVVKSDLPIYSEYVGQAYGLSDVQIQARVQGLVTGMFFKEGSKVKAGDLLYTIDDLPYKSKVAQADGQLADAQTQLVKAKSDLDRVKPLAQSNALSQRDLDAAVAAVGAAEGRVKAAKASKENAMIELGFCRVTAPISGLIGISMVRVGDYVGSLNTRSLNTISDLSEMRVRFPISENDYLEFVEKRKQNMGVAITKRTVDLYTSNGAKYPYPGVFNVANREIDPTTGSIILEVITPNVNNEIRPGQYLKVRFVSDKLTGAILVPQRAVIQLQNLFQVCILGDSNKLESRIVKTGVRVGENWVITEGLSEGDKVIILGNKMIKPNSVVAPIMVQAGKDSLSK
ncbi:MAG: efflux transporter periplasmic adaptor subunit [Bacteroidetes bacterium B1(2017)]|nr:MAG: efflux transporter periplasmic adaptor subunit [Bacteroidetes bacterium B1(2017)]